MNIIRSHEPGDGLSYRFISQRQGNEHFFSFGVATEAMVGFVFPADNDYVDYGYFAEKMGRFIKLESRLVAAYCLFSVVRQQDFHGVPEEFEAYVERYWRLTLQIVRNPVGFFEHGPFVRP